MESSQQFAFLLHSRPYQDNKLLVEFFTQEQGKVAAVAYIHSSKKSDKKALLQPFTPLNIVCKGKNSLKTLSQIEANGTSFKLSGDHLYSAFYINELLVKLLSEGLAHPLLFRQYLLAVQQLANKDDIAPVLRTFEKGLLDELGCSLDFEAVYLIESTHCQFIPEQGFVAYDQQVALPAFDCAHVVAIAEQQIVEGVIAQTYKQLMRQVINGLLDGRPLNSRQLFKK